MTDAVSVTEGSKPESFAGDDTHTTDGKSVTGSSIDELNPQGPPTPYLSSTPGSPYILSRNSSYYGHSAMEEELGDTPPDKLTFFDFFENLTLPARVERWQATVQAQREKLKRQQEKIRHQAGGVKNRAVAEWKKRVPTSEEQLTKYRSRMKRSVDDLNKRWKDTVTISVKEKVSFISAVLNIFFSGYLIGAVPERFYWWFTVQLAYFMPIRFYTYRRKGYHYFLADLCYFVNAMCCLSIWAFPRSKRLFISSYCLAYGNNAVAIVMWRNSLVFHSMDKVVSLFIHVMPPVVLHCIVHLTPDAMLQDRFPAVYTIKYSEPGSAEHYSLLAMLMWATLPYLIWQLSYHFFISVRRAQQIAAGRPTSFTWLRRSYAKTWIGKFVNSLPQALQEPAFMMIQYCYALLTIVPCPLWFWSRWSSVSFLLFVFSWSVWNGANYYMDVFGKRFEKELELMKRDVAKWQNSPGHSALTLSPPAHPIDGTPAPGGTSDGTNGKESVTGSSSDANRSANGTPKGMGAMEMMNLERDHGSRMDAKRSSLDNIPLLDAQTQNGEHDKRARSTGANILNDADKSSVTERKGQ